MSGRNGTLGRHPAIADIRDLLTFRIAMLAAANDRMGQGWLQSLYDLRILEWRVLALVTALRPVPFGDIARALLVDKGQLSRLVKRLLARGLIAAQPDPRDQRLLLLQPTEEGQRLHDRVLQMALERNERVVSALSARETEQLFRLLDKLQPFMEHRVELAAAKDGGKREREEEGGKGHDEATAGGLGRRTPAGRHSSGGLA